MRVNERTKRMNGFIYGKENMDGWMDDKDNCVSIPHQSQVLMHPLFAVGDVALTCSLQRAVIKNIQ